MCSFSKVIPSVSFRGQTAAMGLVAAIAGSACSDIEGEPETWDVNAGSEEGRPIDYGGVLIGLDGTEFRSPDAIKTYMQRQTQLKHLGSESDIKWDGSTAQIPDGLSALQDINCMFEGSSRNCWYPGFDDKTAVEVCFHPNNQAWFNDVVRDVLAVDTGSFVGGWSFVEAESWSDPECELIAEERFEVSGAPGYDGRLGEAPVVYMGHTVKESCGPLFSGNTCMFYGVAMFRIWTQQLDRAYGGFPGDPYMVELEYTIMHEVGHVLGLGHNDLVNPVWGYHSIMWGDSPSTWEFQGFFSCEMEKLLNFTFANSDGALTRYSQTVNGFACSDDY